MTLAELVNSLRVDILRDSAQPHLFSDTYLVQLLNEAEILFARHTHVLRDDSSDFTQITTEQGKARYTLDSRIIHVADIWNEQGRSLRNLNRKKLPRLPGEGRPTAYTLDAAAKTLRLAPPPDQAYDLQMLVARKPLRALTGSRPTASPEIPEEYHNLLTYYASWKAQTANGPEGGQVQSAVEYRALWLEGLREAKREVYHERMGPELRVRNDWTASR